MEDLGLITVPRIEILILGSFLSLSFFAAPLRVGILYWAPNFRALILVSRKMCILEFFIFGLSTVKPLATNTVYLTLTMQKHQEDDVMTIIPHSCEDMISEMS